MAFRVEGSIIKYDIPSTYYFANIKDICIRGGYR